jgi:hypothetical protein
VKLTVFLSGSWLSKDHQRESKVFGLIPDAVVLFEGIRSIENKIFPTEANKKAKI